MGLSFHYKGRFNKKASLREMIEEIEDIATVYKWEYTTYNRSFPSQPDKDHYNDCVYGISFTPPNCESVPIEFLSNGRMSSNVHLEFFGNSDRIDYQKYLYQISVKTQFAGPEVHMILIRLFKYLSKKYFVYFKFIDEGHYWETGDEKLLRETFSRYNELLDIVSHSIQSFPIMPGEKIETYFDRLIVHINKKRKR